MNWISTQTELPDHDLTVLIATTNPCALECCWSNPVWIGFFGGDEWFSGDGSPLEGDLAPTHWQPLPAPPTP